MSKKTFCPFIKDICRADCVFKHHNVSCGSNVSDCLIAVKLFDINERQDDVLQEILKATQSKN